MESHPKSYTNERGETRTTPLYNSWFDMYQRCTSERSKRKRPQYTSTTLCEDWFDFNNFAKWAKQQIGQGEKGFDGHLYQIDKDLLGNSDLYSPSTCCFLPKEVNSFLKKKTSVRNTTGFTGVSLLPNGKYRACVRDPRVGRNKHLGCFLNPKDAYSSYLSEKSKIGKYLAEKYKNCISERAYFALNNL